MKNTFAKRLLSVLLALCAAGLVLGASYGLRRNCEGFGCPNAGILWSVWLALYVVVGAAGLRLRTGLVPGTPSRKITSVALAMLAGLAVTLAGYWLLGSDAA